MSRWFAERFDRLCKVANSRRARLIFGAAIGLPFVCLAILVAVFAVNVPFLDQWELVDLFKKYHDGQLGFADFFAQHNEHRLLFPRLIMFGLAVLSGWNILWEVTASLVLAALAFVFLYKILAKTITNQILRWLAAITISAILFSPIQWENWLWGWQLQWYLNVLGLIVAVWALTAWEATPLKRVIVAVLAAIVATYSLASGFFVWIICLPILWLSRPLRRWLWLWLAMALGAISLHYIGYHDPLNHPSKTLFLHDPITFLGYIMTYLGHPVTLTWRHAFLVTPVYLVGLGAAIIYQYRRAKNQLSGSLLPWLCLGLYACFAAVSTAATRQGFGVEQAYASRYTTLSQFLLIAFVVLLYKILEQAITQKKTVALRRVRYVAVAGLVILTAMVLLNSAKGALQLRRHGLYLRDVQYCAQTASSVDEECLYKLYPLEDIAWQRLLYLRSIHWGGQ